MKKNTKIALCLLMCLNMSLPVVLLTPWHKLSLNNYNSPYWK